MSLPVPQNAMDVDFDAGVEPALVRRGAKIVSAMWEERADQADMEVCRDTAGECCDGDAVETLSWSATVGGIKTEQIQVEECEMFRRRLQPDARSCARLHDTSKKKIKAQVCCLPSFWGGAAFLSPSLGWCCSLPPRRCSMGLRVRCPARSSIARR